MVDDESQGPVDVSEGVVEASEDVVEGDFDHLFGIVTDGFIGAIGGLVGTAAMTVVLLIAARLNVFDLGGFAMLSELIGADVLFEANPAAIGYLLFLATGMVMWPLLFASIGSFLPGEKFATKGLSYGVVLWSGFAPAFYADYAGTAMVLYLVLVLVGHLTYGFALGSVFDYLSNRPDTLI